MTKTNAILVLIYGLLVMGGGLMGYLKAGSLASLIMGFSFGTLLLCSGWFLLQQSTLAYFSTLALSGFLSLFFLFRFYHSGSFMPAGLMVLLSLGILAYTFFSKR